MNSEAWNKMWVMQLLFFLLFPFCNIASNNVVKLIIKITMKSKSNKKYRQL